MSVILISKPTTRKKIVVKKKKELPNITIGPIVQTPNKSEYFRIIFRNNTWQKRIGENVQYIVMMYETAYKNRLYIREGTKETGWKVCCKHKKDDSEILEAQIYVAGATEEMKKYISQFEGDYNEVWVAFDRVFRGKHFYIEKQDKI